MEDEKVAIYIDGGNLYHKLKDLKVPNTTDFNYYGLCEYLARGRKIVVHRYYVGVVRAKKDDKKGQRLRKAQLVGTHFFVNFVYTLMDM